MNWDAIGASAEGLAAIGVIVSLIYVALQVRDNSNQTRSQMLQALVFEQSRVLDAITKSDDNVETWLKIHNGSPLEPKEKIRSIFIISQVSHTYLAIQIAYDKGQLDQAFYDDAKEQIRDMLGSRLGSVRVEKYLRRIHPNLSKLEIFSPVLEQANKTRRELERSQSLEK